MQNQTNIEGFKLSPHQRHLWSLKHHELAYQVQSAILITGNLNIKLLQTALDSIIHKHEILRTTFHHQVGLKSPIQVVAKSNTLSWRLINVNDLDFQEHQAKIEEVFQEEKQRVFDVGQESILRLCLLTLSADKHILIISLPAMNADTRTIRNLFEEICQFYHDQAIGDEEVVQYIQFSEWQNQLLEDEDELAGQKYWNQQDFSALHSFNLPFEEKQNGDSTKFEFKFIEYSIEPDIFNKITAVAQKYHTSTSGLLLTCWQVLLSRLTEQQDIIIGTAFDGRQYEELKRSLGLFTKYLPINCHFETHTKFSDILKQVDTSLLNASEWQEYFNYQEPTAFWPLAFEFAELPGEFTVGDVYFSIYRQHACIDRFKLKLTCHQNSEYLNSEYLKIELQYDVNYFQLANIQRLAEQFLTLLESVINHPEAEALKLNILSERERQQLLVEFNQTTINYPTELCIHKLIEEQAAKTPANIAIAFEGEQLTYRELNSRANQLAHYLQHLGIGPEVLVGICTERSLLTIIGILGILKAGAAYVPIEPNNPSDRLSFILQDTQATVLLTQQQLVANFPPHTAQVVCLDNWEIIAQESDQNPVSNVKSDNLIYVIYTSGSTGKPKGVAVEHRHLLNYVQGILAKLDLPVNANFAIVSTFAADLGNTVIFSALCTGGCLHIISPERVTDPVALADYCRRYPINCLKIVPSHLNALLTSVNPEDILPSPQLILGGETASWELIEQIQQHNLDCQILNHYGPTEATVGVLTFPVEQLEIGQSKTVPIGRPISNTQVYLLDEHLQPVPLSVPGELYIGGANLVRGYFNRPELTAEKFIPNPFSSNQGERLYKTSDRAKFRTDGNIEFLGRSDRQVKIHGFRLELEEVEVVLSQHPSVRKAVVIVREDRLIAYLVLNPEQTPNTSAFRSFLQERLPEYMLPSAFVILDVMPLTPNGKVDLQALPTPDTTRPELAKAYVPPCTFVEQLLARIWAEVLGLEQVGIHDNFFELGGDSILSIQVISKANQSGLQLSPKHLFEYQTIAELAAVADVAEFVQTQQGLITGQVLLTPIQHWFFGQNLPDPHHWNQAVLLEVRQNLDCRVLEQVVQQLLKHHDALRMRFQPTENGWQQINADPNEVTPITRRDFSALSEAEQLSAMSELQAILNLSSGPLMRVAYLDLGEQKLSRLLIIVHHLVIDGVSWRILLEDLYTGYQQLSQGQEIHLPPKTTAFQHWAEKLGEYAHSAALLQELNYWLREPQSQVLSLPTDFSENQNANTVGAAETISVSLSLEETQALLQQVPTAYQTQVNDVLLTALVQTFAEWTEQRSLLLTLEGHGREEIFEDVNLSRTVGWFTSHFPVLLTLGDAFTPEDALKTIKEQIRRIPNRGIGYGILYYLSNYAKIVAQLRDLPQAQVKFNYLGQFDQVLQDTTTWALAPESTGSTRSLRGDRSHLLEIDGMVTGGQLRLHWTYSQNIHHSWTIERLAESFIEAVRSLISHCQSLEVGGYTPSDFPEAELSQQELDKLIAKISQMSR